MQGVCVRPDTDSPVAPERATPSEPNPTRSQGVRRYGYGSNWATPEAREARWQGFFDAYQQRVEREVRDGQQTKAQALAGLQDYHDKIKQELGYDFQFSQFFREPRADALGKIAFPSSRSIDSYTELSDSQKTAMRGNYQKLRADVEWRVALGTMTEVEAQKVLQERNDFLRKTYDLVIE